jgi:hypothetical protein
MGSAFLYLRPASLPFRAPAQREIFFSPTQRAWRTRCEDFQSLLSLGCVCVTVQMHRRRGSPKTLFHPLSNGWADDDP